MLSDKVPEDAYKWTWNLMSFPRQILVHLHTAKVLETDTQRSDLHQIRSVNLHQPYCVKKGWRAVDLRGWKELLFQWCYCSWVHLFVTWQAHGTRLAIGIINVPIHTFDIFAVFEDIPSFAAAMGANCCCGARQKEAFSVSDQLSWQPFKSFECRRRLHAVPNKQEERDAGSPKAKVVMGVDEWDMKRDTDTAQPTTGKATTQGKHKILL